MNSGGLNFTATNIYCDNLNVKNPSDLTVHDLTVTNNVSVGNSLTVHDLTVTNNVSVGNSLSLVDLNNKSFLWENRDIGIASNGELQLRYSDGNIPLLYITPTGNVFIGGASYGNLTCFGNITTPQFFKGSQYPASAIFGTLASPLAFTSAGGGNPYQYGSGFVTLSVEGRSTVIGITSGTNTSNKLVVSYIYNGSTTKFNNTNCIPEVRMSFVNTINYSVLSVGTSFNSVNGNIDTVISFADPSGTSAALAIGVPFVLDIECKLIGA